MVDNCREAIEYYRKVFGGELKNVMTGAVDEMFKGHEAKIIHAELYVNDTCLLFFGDPFEEIREGSRFGVLLDLDSEEEINRLYKELLEDRPPLMELQKTFWGALFAVVKDRYGVTWSLNYTLA
jgi:PhnB protein